jgi:predicted amino acid dehydrogenase
LLPERLLERLVRKRGPMLVSHITGVRSKAGPEAEGWFVGCLLSPRQFLDLPADLVVNKIAAAANLAADQGAGIVGLGALTSVAADAGVSVAARAKVPVTTGNSYTVWTAVEGARRAAELMGIEVARARAAVVGATGAIGRVCCQILSGWVSELTLVGRERARLEAVAASLDGGAEIRCATEVARALREADVVITVTSALDTVVPAESLKPGAVVCDVARPRDVAREVAERRKDVLVIEGGVVEVPGKVDFGFEFGFPSNMTFACMAETMILALEGRYECYSLGRELSLEKVLEMGRLAEKHGFRLASFRSFDREVTPEQIARTRELAHQVRRKA